MNRARWFALFLVTAGGLAAADLVDLASLGHPAGEAVGLLQRQVTSDDLVLDDDLLKANPPVYLHLTDADVPTALQAMAYALDAWWLDQQSIHFTRNPLARPEAVVSRSRATNLLDRMESEAIARRLMQPWLHDERCGLAYDPKSGYFSATLDREGHQHLIAILGLLEHGQASVPPLRILPSPPPDIAVDIPPGDEPLGEWLVDVARATDIHCAVHAAVGQHPVPMGAIREAKNVQTIAEALERLGIGSAVVDGVWCVGPRPTGKRRHPSRARTYAMLPIDQITGDPALLTLELVARLDPPLASHEAIEYVPWTGKLLIGADDDRITQVLDAIEAMERRE